jgi:hypothetical protein
MMGAQSPNQWSQLFLGPLVFYYRSHYQDLRLASVIPFEILKNNRYPPKVVTRNR